MRQARRIQLALAIALGVLTVIGLALSHRSVGYARDEGIYFEASRSYAAWFSADNKFDQKVRDKHFGVNHEHPALMKTAAGLSARAFAEAPAAAKKGERGGVLPVMPEGAAMRLPAQILSGLGVALLFLLGARRDGLWSGLVAAGAFILLPRVWFHAGLHAFDVPIAVAILAVAATYMRGLEDHRYGLAVGPLLGIAIAIKHNALFIGPLLAVHYYVALWWNVRRHRRTITRGQLVPLPLLSMATLAPLTAWALWPWMWSHPIKRMTDYLAFHGEHNWYNIEFLGQNFNQPPMPVSYPAVMTWATVPAVVLVLAIIGLVISLRTDLREMYDDAETPTTLHPLPGGWARLPGLWLGLLSAFPILLISWPWTPIFGGTKHWITAYPFLALCAARAWGAITSHAPIPRPALAVPVATALVLTPGAIATYDAHPYGLSQYSAIVGGPRGAAQLGLNRGFWGHAAPAMIPSLAERMPRGGTVYLHDLHESARKQYAREGRWPPAVIGAPISRAEAGLLFHEMHMRTYEVQLWNRLGSAGPSAVVELDDVPLTSLYTE